MASLRANRVVQTGESHLSLKAIFGVNRATRGNVHFIDDKTVVYPSGKNLVFYNLTTQSNEQKFLQGTERCTDISAIGTSPNRKFLVIAEKGFDSHPYITFVESNTMKRRRVLTTSEVNSEEYISMAFSRDGTYFIALSGEPEYKLLLWINDPKTKLAASVTLKDECYHCSVSPENKYICVTGSGILQIFKYEEFQLRCILNGISSVGHGKKDNDKYTAHCWLDKDRLVVANEKGDLFLIEGAEFRYMLSTSPSDGLQIHYIIQYGKGFICGGERGVITFYEYCHDAKQRFKRHKSYKVDTSNIGDPDQHHFVQFLDKSIEFLSASPSNELLAFTTRSGQIFTLNLATAETLKDEELKFDFLTVPFHFDKIVGLDTCIRKPLIGTCSMDKTVRLWDYVDFSVNLVKRFEQETYSIALHPTGLFMVIGFSDKLRFMNILGSELREVKSFPIKNCQEVKFSHGGQYFAAVNGNVINVYSTYMLQFVYGLRGHSGRIKNLCWTNNDARIVSVGMDGYIYEYDVSLEKVKYEFHLKHVSFTGVTSDGKSIYAISNDGMLRDIAEGQVSSEHVVNNIGMNSEKTDFDSLLATNIALCCILVSPIHKYLFGGTVDGTIIAYSYPAIQFIEDRLFVHCKAVTRMCLTFDEKLLITCSEDGTLCMMELKERDGGKIKRDFKYSEEILISNRELDEKNVEIQELKAKISEMKSDFEYQSRKKELAFNEQLREQSKNFKLEIQKKNEKLLQIVNEKQNLIKEFEHKMKTVDKDHEVEIAKLEHEYNQRLSAQTEQINTIKKEKSNARKQHLEEFSQREEKFEQEMQNMKQVFSERVRDLEMKIFKLNEQRNNLIQDHQESLRQQEEDSTKEIEQIREEFEKKKNEWKEMESKLRAKKKARKQKEKELLNMISNLNETIGKLRKEIEEQEIHQKILSKDIRSLNTEKKEREETIVDKEKRISTLKKQNQELEKFKFVQDYKITTLTDRLKPSKEKISELQKELNRMDHELESNEASIQKLQSHVKDLELKIEATNRENHSLKATLRDAETYKNRMKAEIHSCVQLIQEPRALKDALKNLYIKYVTSQVKASAQKDADFQKEYDRQRQYLERTVDSLKKKMLKGGETKQSENTRILHENVTLVSEINQLRREVRALRAKLKEKEQSDMIMNAAQQTSLPPPPLPPHHHHHQNRHQHPKVVNLSKTAPSSPVKPATAHPMSRTFGGASQKLNPNLTSLEDAKREIELQKLEIQALRDKIEYLEAERDWKVRSRPISREKLPPMEGFG